MDPKNIRPDGQLWRNFYGRLRGKPLRASQQDLLDEFLPKIRLNGVSRAENPARVPLELAPLTKGRALWLEIGFGGGEHLVHQAQKHTDTCFIGCEPYINAIAMTLHKIRENAIDNIYLYPGDVRDLLELLPPGVLDRVFLLYPDPWPKKRHHRRRFVNAEYLRPLVRAMRKGATLRLCSDIGDYIRQALEQVPQAGLCWQGETAQDWRLPWDDWQPTRYEQKAVRAGRTPIYLTFTKPATPKPAPAV